MDDVIYKRELNHSYMVIRCHDPQLQDKYVYRTLMHNRIGKLLDCSLRSLDQEVFLYYDISSRQPLERLYGTKKLGMEELEQIIRQIAAMQEDLGEYLLDEQGLVLNTGMILADVETEELYFCYVPEKINDDNRYMELAEFFLEHVDHGEEHAVNTAYSFYKMCKADYFVLSAFLPFLEKETAAWKRKSSGGQDWSLEEYKPEKGEETKADDTKTGEIRKPPKQQPSREKRNWFTGIFGRRRSAKQPAQKEEEWPDTVWDSYVGQLNPAGSQETVYFSDLDRTDRADGEHYLLQEIDGDQSILLEDFPVSVGKLKGKVTVVLPDASVSRMHARFETGMDGIYIRDLNSRNGTTVNGIKLSPNETVLLQNGDIIRFGRVGFRCERV